MKSNLTLIGLFSVLLVLVFVSTLNSVYPQDIIPNAEAEDDKYYEKIQYDNRILPDIDEFVDVQIKNTTDTKSSNQIPSSIMKENSTDTVLKFFAIQHSQSGSISEINTTTYTLELNDISDNTILFSDRPDRIVTSVSTSEFIGNWSVGEDSFATNAPNAVLVLDEIEGKHQSSILVELFNPIYDVDKKKLIYKVILNNVTHVDLWSELGQTTIVIDNGDGNATIDHH